MAICFKNFEIDDHFVAKARTWSLNYKYAITYGNNDVSYPYEGFKNIIAVSDGEKIVTRPTDIIKGKEYFGHVSYDYKNQIENLVSEHPEYIKFPDFFFFEPDIKLEFSKKNVQIHHKYPEAIFQDICSTQLPVALNNTIPKIFKPLTNKSNYIDTANKIIEQLRKGNIYEMNYCISFVAAASEIDIPYTFASLIETSPTPFSCLVKHDDQYLICASPERYFKLNDGKIISQPIKGTKKARDKDNIENQRSTLHNSPKERNENVMIVDLVRNDLSKVCIAGTVKVEELFGVYLFSNVFQMISTIAGQLLKECSVTDVLRHTFPMGSMTGAPKYRTLELIEQYENFRRNIYSGTIGYIDENGDADFNVVIRSLFYNGENKLLSFSVGSGITVLSNPAQEYLECLLKAEKMLKSANGIIKD